jgi:Mn2+/Fe2+ NRAMP family transporter
MKLMNGGIQLADHANNEVHENGNSSNSTTNSIEAAPIPKNFSEYFKNIGAGFVFLLTIVGVGDLTGSVSNGSKFGFAALWTLLLAVILRFVILEAIGRFGLTNPGGLSPMEAFNRLYGRWIRWVFALLAIIFFFTSMSGYIKGCADILNALFPFLPVSAWGVITIAFGLFMIYNPVYKNIEKMFKYLLVVVFFTVLIATIMLKPDWGAFFAGMVPSIPPGVEDLRGTMFVLIGAIGTVLGGLGTLIYPYLIKQKGWTTPGHVKVIRFDLSFTIIMLFIIDALFYIPPVVLVHNQNGAVVKTAQDIFNMMHGLLGDFFTSLFMIGIFGAAITTVIGMPYGIAHIFQESVYGKLDTKHWTWKFATIFCWIPGLFVVFTGIPFTTITLLSGNISVITSLIIGTGIFLIGNMPKLIGRENRNPWWSNLGLGAALIVLWYLTGLRGIEMFHSFFG